MAACSRSSSTASTIDDRLASPSKSTEFGAISVGVIGGFERVTVDQLAVVIAIDPGGEHPRRSRGMRCVYVDPIGDEIAVDLLASAYPTVIGPVGDAAGRPAISDRRPRR